MNILFRCDGSVEVGMGHVVRCLALADHLRDSYDCSVQFAMRQSELGINKVKESYPVLESNEKDFNYKEWLTDCIEKTKTNVLIMDMRDGLTRKELKSIKKKTGIEVITIDDPEEKRLEADLAFYPPVPQLKNMSWEGFKGELHIGWEYVILRKEFLKQYLKPKNTIPNVLISMGGTDEENMTEFVVNSLNQVNKKFKAIIIVGAGYPYLKQLEKYLKEVQYAFELHQNPKNIALVMSQVDFAIISFGQTAYELVPLNIPALYFCLTKDHEESAQLFNKERIGESLGFYFDIKYHNTVETVTNLLKEKEIIGEMSHRLQSINISNLDLITQFIIRDNIYV